MADAAETPEKQEEEVAITPEQEADARLTEMFAEMNYSPDDEVEEEPGEEGQESDDDTKELPAVKPEAKVDKPAEEKWKPSTLVRTAKRLGVSDAKIASLSVDALDLLCDQLLEQQDAEIRSAEEKKKADAEPELDEDEKLLQELAEDLDPKVLKLLESNVKKTKAMEAERKAEKQAAEQRRMQDMVNQVDAAFAEFDNPMLGGTASVAAMQQGTPELDRRNMVVQYTLQNPIPGKTLAESIRINVTKLLGIVRSEKPVADPADDKKKKWAAAGTSRPTKRAESQEKGDAAAVKAVSRWFKENAIEDE